jgi:hypothetical protein
MNVAMGELSGGQIDPAFTQSSMEADYVRVYLTNNFLIIINKKAN